MPKDKSQAQHQKSRIKKHESFFIAWNGIIGSEKGKQTSIDMNPLNLHVKLNHHCHHWHSINVIISRAKAEVHHQMKRRRCFPLMLSPPFIIGCAITVLPAPEKGLAVHNLFVFPH